MSYFRADPSKPESYSVQGVATGFRAVVGALAAVLSLLAAWILASELTSPKLGYFPSDVTEANTMYDVRTSAATAAEVGMVRGDLWTAAAITAAAPSLFEATDTSNEQAAQSEIESMNAIATRAARLSPHDARIWLVLAGLDFIVDKNSSKGADALKLSYYTGPNEIALMPLRVLIAVGSNAISDDEVRSLVPMDIQIMAGQRPDLKPAIAMAYSHASPNGREVIESALKGIDPIFLKAITAPHSGGQIPN